MDNLSFTKIDTLFMSKALSLAKKSIISRDVPVGSVIVHNGNIIGKGYNQIEKRKNPLAHAEISAIDSAVKKYGHKHLLDCDMYVTLEPCSMCAGAIVLSRINRVFIGAKDPKTGAGGSLFNILNDKKLNHRCEVHFGILENECSVLIKDFFKELRRIK
jgi:tRNA(adenine34) deaminase